MNITLRSNFKFRSGYDILLKTILNNQKKYNLDLYPISFHDVDESYSIFFKNNPNINHKTELVIMPPPEDHVLHPIYRLPHHSNRIFFTMWEATKISYSFIEFLNQCKLIIVPNEWNKQNFITSGLTTRIEVLPLFVDTSIFNYKSPVNRDGLKIGTSNADDRKRIHDVIYIFNEVFRDYEDVSLEVKIRKEERNLVNNVLNKNISIICEDYSQNELVDWYKDLDLYMTCVSAEGWGLMLHECMAIGRPIIAPNYAGISEYLSIVNGYPVKYTEVDATGYWKYPNSKWSMYDKEDMKNTLLNCYRNKEELEIKGKQASIDMTKLDINYFMSSLSTLLESTYSE